MTEKIAFKYRIYPTKNQRKTIDSWIHSCWWFYRYVLHHYEDDYRAAKANFHREVMCWYYGNAAYHPYWYTVTGKYKIPKEYYPNGAPIRYQGKGSLSTYKLLQRARNDRKHLQEVPAVVMQEVLERVAHAFDKFWKEGGGYPRYPKERNYQSITWTGVDNIWIDEKTGALSLSKFPGLLKVVYHRPVPGKIKRVNISKDILGQYFASVICEFEPDEPKPVQKEKIVGIDMNIKQRGPSERSFICLSTGEHIDIPRWYTQYETKLGKIQKKMSKHASGSPEWMKYNRHLKHLYDDVSNAKSNWLHNLTRNLADCYDFVAIEDMTLTGFHKKRNDPSEATNYQLQGERAIRKAWTETPFGEFKRQLQYKMKNHVIAVEPAYTSKTCHKCGFVNKDLSLSEREWKCPVCGATHDRDVNAAINIRERGLVFINNPLKTKEEKVA